LFRGVVATHSVDCDSHGQLLLFFCKLQSDTGIDIAAVGAGAVCEFGIITFWAHRIVNRLKTMVAAACACPASACFLGW
jgi:hypothetical protein